MSEELGKIEKPEVYAFKAKRKIYLVPLVNPWEDGPEEYQEKFQRYWGQVNEQLDKLELKLGKVNRIYHEGIFTQGEEGIKATDTLNKRSGEIAKLRCEQEAVFEVVEDMALTGESMDWERCLAVDFYTEKAAMQVYELYMEALRKRWEKIAHQIDTTLQEGEAGLLFIRERHGVQFPQDIEVFTISPPALDEIHRWFRDRAQQQQSSSAE